MELRTEILDGPETGESGDGGDCQLARIVCPAYGGYFLRFHAQWGDELPGCGGGLTGKVSMTAGSRRNL